MSKHNFQECEEHECECLRFREAWSPGSIYRPGEVVPCQGSSYVAIHWNQSDPPPSQNWALLASKGADGPAGPAGPAGAAGSSDLYVFTPPPGDQIVNVGTAGQDLAALAVPPGSYMIVGQISGFYNSDSDDQNWTFDVRIASTVISSTSGRLVGFGGGGIVGTDVTVGSANICAHWISTVGDSIVLRGSGYSVQVQKSQIRFMALKVGAIHS